MGLDGFPRTRQGTGVPRGNDEAGGETPPLQQRPARRRRNSRLGGIWSISALYWKFLLR